METINLDAPRTARKIKRQLKADRPKIIGLGIATCALAIAPYVGVFVALATGVWSFWIVARGFLAIHNFEMDMEDAGISEPEQDRLAIGYKSIIVNGAFWFIALVGASIVASKFGGLLKQFIDF